MRIARLYRRRADDGQPELLARIVASSDTGPAVVEPVDATRLAAIRDLLAIGVPGPDDTTLFLEDGEAFVRAMPDGFRGSHLFALPE